MSNGYPGDFLKFFFQWTLLNLNYNEISEKDKEVQRVLEFGREYADLFDLVRYEATVLVREECVGQGKNDEAPSGPIKTASIQLRKTLSINPDAVCAKCRPVKIKECLKTRTIPYSFESFEALIRILYQIRCNLFHGDKTEYENGIQAKRNVFLVNIGNRILEHVLRSISSDTQP